MRFIFSSVRLKLVGQLCVDQDGLKEFVLEEHDYGKEMKERAEPGETEEVTEEMKKWVEKLGGMIMTQRCILSIYRG